MKTLRLIAPAAVVALAGTTNAQMFLTERAVRSVNVVEKTGISYTHTYNLGDEALTRIDGGPTTDNFDFRASAEFYDIYTSDANGSEDANGEYLSIVSQFAFFDELTGAATGNNIDSVFIELDDGSIAFANSLVSFDLGSNLGELAGSDGHAVRLLGETDGKVTYGGFGLSRFTVGFNNQAPVVPAPATLAAMAAAAAFGTRRRR